MTTTASVAVVPALPQVQVLPAVQFATRFKPRYYADTWENVPNDPQFAESDHGPVDMSELCDSIAFHGVLSPVSVVDDEVDEGHHRVVAALHTGAPIPFYHWT